jgi:hypothetical protein
MRRRYDESRRHVHTLHVDDGYTTNPTMQGCLHTRHRGFIIELHRVNHILLNEENGESGWVAATNFLARHPRNRDVDLAIRSEGGSEKVAAKISFVSSSKTSPERFSIMLNEELAITPTWCANYQMVRSGQPTGC